MLSLLLAGLALQAAQAVPAAANVQRLEPRACTAEPNYVTKERLPLRSATFRLSGTLTASELNPDDFTPFASLALLQEERPEELSAVLSIQPITRRRFDVTLRRLIHNELRERSVIGRVPSEGSVPFELEVTADNMAVFRLGRVNARVPLNDLRPTAVVLGCSSGSFRFDDLVVTG